MIIILEENGLHYAVGRCYKGDVIVQMRLVCVEGRGVNNIS